MPYTLGLDFGTNSVRCLIVDIASGAEIGTAVHEYETGEAGIMLDASDHNVARQNPSDYIQGIENTVFGALVAIGLSAAALSAASTSVHQALGNVVSTPAHLSLPTWLILGVLVFTPTANAVAAAFPALRTVGGSIAASLKR